MIHSIFMPFIRNLYSNDEYAKRRIDKLLKETENEEDEKNKGEHLPE